MNPEASQGLEEQKEAQEGETQGESLRVKSLVWNRRGIQPGLSITKLCLSAQARQRALEPGRPQVGTGKEAARAGRGEKQSLARQRLEQSLDAGTGMHIV